MRYIAFLRGINVSGQKLIKMEVLRQHFNLPGFSNVVSYIQSGNILFDTEEIDEGGLRAAIETMLAERLGYPVPTIVRSIDNIREVIARSPYAETAEDGRNLYVSFLSAPPADSLHRTLEAFKAAHEDYTVQNREVYLMLQSYGNTKLNNALIEKKLKVMATTRNWATINKILEL